MKDSWWLQKAIALQRAADIGAHMPSLINSKEWIRWYYAHLKCGWSNSSAEALDDLEEMPVLKAMTAPQLAGNNLAYSSGISRKIGISLVAKNLWKSLYACWNWSGRLKRFAQHFVMRASLTFTKEKASTFFSCTCWKGAEQSYRWGRKNCSTTELVWFPYWSRDCWHGVHGSSSSDVNK